MILFSSISLMIFLSFSSHFQNYPAPPKTNELLFYIQRNHNSNTIVYDANFDSNGNLKEDEPIVVYWIRYDDDGEKMELRTIEKWYAYGVDWEKVEGKNMYELTMVADNSHIFMLEQTEPFKAIVTTQINKTQSVLESMYIFADNSKAWPTVEYIEFFGYNKNSKLKEYEKVIVD